MPWENAPIIHKTSIDLLLVKHETSISFGDSPWITGEQWLCFPLSGLTEVKKQNKKNTCSPWFLDHFCWAYEAFSDVL
jgi:hypothetical protein